MTDTQQSLIGGFHAVMSALEKQRALECIWLASGRRDGRAEALRQAAGARGVAIASADMSALDLEVRLVHRGSGLPLAPSGTLVRPSAGPWPFQGNTVFSCLTSCRPRI